MPENEDAFQVALGGPDAVNFLGQDQQSGGTAPLVGGSITLDQIVLACTGKVRDLRIGTPSAGPIADFCLTEVAVGPDGNMLNDLIKVIPQVNQTPGHAGG